MPAQSVADFIIKQLASWGVKRIYGVAGDGNLHLFDCLSRNNAIRLITVRHETTAALMASAEAKLTGKLAVCTATMGPGLGHLLNGLADAWADRVPVLALTGQVESDKIGADEKQYIDQQLFIQPLAAFSATVSAPAAAQTLLRKAMHLALEKKTLTHLSIPKDILKAPVSLTPVPPPLLIRPASPEKRELEKALTLMIGAKKPVILAGAGAKRAEREISKLAEVWGAPIVTSFGAKGVFSERNPEVLGGIGEGGNPLIPSWIRSADVVLCAGVMWWPAAYTPGAARVIQIDTRPENVGRSVPAEIGIIGDVSVTSTLLASGLLEHDYIPDASWKTEALQMRSEWSRQQNREGRKNDSADAGIHPSVLIRAVENVVDDNAIIAVDTGDVTVWVNRQFRAKNKRFFFPVNGEQWVSGSRRRWRPNWLPPTDKSLPCSETGDCKCRWLI